MNDDDLIAELQRLPREEQPPAQVRAAIADQLRARSRRVRARLVWRSGLATAVVVAAFLAGRMSAPSRSTPPPPTRQYALLLYGGGPATSDRISEYAGWARDLVRDGRRAGGERLGDDAWVVGNQSVDARLRGFFIVEARDVNEAQTLARSHPHAKYGGSVVVQEVVTRSRP